MIKVEQNTSASTTISRIRNKAHNLTVIELEIYQT